MAICNATFSADVTVYGDAASFLFGLLGAPSEKWGQEPLFDKKPKRGHDSFSETKRGTWFIFNVFILDNSEPVVYYENMDWLDIYWDADIERYLAQHGVSREDFENVIRNPIGEDSSDSSGRPIRFGFAVDGRKIAAVFERIDDLTVLPITAYEVK